MLFRKDMPRCCSYCKWGTKLEKQQMLCIKKGIVSESFACKKFSYDPCKRIPKKAKALNFDKYSNEDFSL